jgi:hypothetical protein
MSILLLNVFLVYVFCFGVYLFYCFFSNKFVVWIYNFLLVIVCFRFYKILFVCKLLKIISNYRLVCCDEINNGLFNESILIFINFIDEL